MPSYDYVCDKCGHQFEEFQSMSADQLKDCPSCNTSSLRRLIGGGLGVIFKGSGFYVNDSKKSSGKNSPGKPSTPDSPAATTTPATGAATASGASATPATPVATKPAGAGV